MKVSAVNGYWWDKPFLTRMLTWILREFGMTTRDLRFARFKRCTRIFSGLAWPLQREIVVRIDKAERFPYEHKTANRKDLTLADQVECLVFITAHEVAHVYQRKVRRGVSYGGRERQTDWHALKVLDAFREQRDDLLSDWERPGRESKTVKIVSIVEQRRAKIEGHLASWQRKLKLAQTKVKLYRKRLRGYERRAAKKFAREAHEA